MKEKLKKFFSYLYPIRLKNISSNYSNSLELSYENGKLVVNTKHVNYSYGSLHRLFREVISKLMPIAESSKILILGFGAGSIADILLNEYQLSVNVTGVDIDSKMFYIFKKYYNIPHKNLMLVCQHATEFLKEETLQYDYIFVDLFIHEKVPSIFLSADFIKLLKDSINKNGVIVMNTMLPKSHSFFSTWKEHFGENVKIDVLENVNTICYSK